MYNFKTKIVFNHRYILTKNRYTLTYVYIRFTWFYIIGYITYFVI